MSEGKIFDCPLPDAANSGVIRLGHGGGGRLTANLVNNVFLPRLGSDIAAQLDDAAIINLQSTRLAFSTDAFVVSPIFFPGGDIGSLSVYGTVNDLAMRGAKPLYISASFIMEEGFAINELERIIDSFGKACRTANVSLLAADTKVVERNACDKIFISTTGIGLLEVDPVPAATRAQAGDIILLSGDIGRHGMAIMSCREGLDLDAEILSDSAPLNHSVKSLIDEIGTSSLKTLRDITRGGLATVLNEIAVSSDVGIEIVEDCIPVEEQVFAICEILGLDPLYVACEGRFLLICSEDKANECLDVLRRYEASAAIVGKVSELHKQRVTMRTRIGGNRIVDMLSGEQLPRIC